MGFSFLSANNTTTIMRKQFRGDVTMNEPCRYQQLTTENVKIMSVEELIRNGALDYDGDVTMIGDTACDVDINGDLRIIE